MVSTQLQCAKNQGAHVCVCKKYIQIVDKYIQILLINIK